LNDEVHHHILHPRKVQPKYEVHQWVLHSCLDEFWLVQPLYCELLINVIDPIPDHLLELYNCKSECVFIETTIVRIFIRLGRRLHPRIL
jgi:hypothetical protein